MTLACSRATGELWLRPRLAGLGTAFPELELKLLIGDDFSGLRSDEYDLAVFYQRHPVPDRILGAPVLDLQLAADAPVAQVAVRLSDMLPSGEVLRVCHQVLNLTHRHGHAAPEPLVPGRMEKVRIALSACGHCFAPGHRLRIAVASAYWPMVWPAPSPATLTIATAGSTLTLPCRNGGDEAAPLPPALHGTDAPATRVDPGRIERWSRIDHVTGECTYITEGVGGLFGEGVLRFEDIDTTLSHSLRREFTIRPDDPLSASYVLTQSYEMGRDGWRIRIESRTAMRSDAGNFYLDGAMQVFENGEPVWKREWTEAVPRNLI